MDSDRQDRFRQLLDELLPLSEDQRTARLETACADDDKLRSEVEAALEVGKATESVSMPPLSQPLHPGAKALEGGEVRLAQRIGNYKITRRIGAGGMGTVFEAQQESPSRKVALKVINPDRVSANALRRFEYESQVLGRLQHAGIAQIFEAGTFVSVSGTQPFFAMEFIDGETLTTYASRQKLGERERLDLMVGICDAVHHAHLRGVIHRDLKPGNIIVNREGQPKVLDFGVARATEGDLQRNTWQTSAGDLVGTIPYMSPEQATGDPDLLDFSSDVYTLGVITYELLAGRLPYDLSKKPWQEQVRMITSVEPTPLSSVRRGTPTDLEIILDKVLAKEKDRRYDSADALASDIRRYLNDEPIEARPPSAIYRLSKFTKRHKALVVGLTGLFAVLAAWLGREMIHSAETEHNLIESIRQNIHLARQRGDWQQALASYDQALRRDYPDRVEMRLGKVEAWDALGERELTLQALHSLGDIAPKSNHRAEYLLWQAEMMLSQPLEAREEARPLIQQAIDAGLDSARQAYAQALIAGNLKDTVRLLEESLVHDPYNYRAHMTLGVTLLFDGMPEQALERFRIIGELFPQTFEPDVFEGFAASVLDRADAMEEISNELEAHLEPQVSAAIRQCYRLLAGIQHAFDDYDPLDQVGQVKSMMGLALMSGTIAMQVKPLVAELSLLRHAPFLMPWWSKLQSTPGALMDITFWDPVISDTDDGFAHFYYGILLQRTGQHDRAAAEARHALENPGLVNIRRPATILLLDALYRPALNAGRDQVWQHPNAAGIHTNLQAVLKFDNLSYKYLCFCGMIAHLLRDHDLARSALLRSYALKPDYGLTLHELASVHFDLGLYEAAIQFAAESLEHGNKSEQILRASIERLGNIGRPSFGQSLDKFLRERDLERFLPAKVESESG